MDGRSINSKLAGLGEARININNRIQMQLRPRMTKAVTSIDALVMKTITSIQPQIYVDTKDWKIPSNLMLADPQFNIPQQIDLLIGVELYSSFILPNQLRMGRNLPILQESTLGWIVMGSILKNDKQCEEFCGVGTVELDEQIKRFWELEEYVPRKRFTTEELKCETLFDATTKREKGRFVVKLPLQNSPNVLGESRNLAYNRLMAVERKLKRDKEIQQLYVNFMREYESAGHMEDVTSTVLEGPKYYMPHHCVLKPSSSTTKLRVVFDASAKCNNNISLNEIMLAGPRIQDELFAILIRFRLKKYVFTADIQQMYRQILLAPEDRNLQLILWRENETVPIKTYRLRTVTYGTKAAPYLATKVLKRLAEDEEVEFPLGTKAINDFYFDDVLTGADDINEAIKIQHQLRELLANGGFRLRKWCANHPSLIQNIPSEDLELNLDFNNKSEHFTKPLGLIWHPVADQFQITVQLRKHEVITKRTILSETAQLFDPLGLVNPITVTAKIFMQNLWKTDIGWDDEVSPAMQEKWKEYQNGLESLRALMIPRYMYEGVHSGRVVLHAFADASERVYGTAIYLQTRNTSGETIVRLLCARSRVAPLKKTKLPLLELCAAKMAAEVVKGISSLICISLDDIHYWSDSEIVLNWIKRDAATLVTFVANRVSDIQSMSDINKWKYVPSKDNPADLVSRGCTAEQLIKDGIWFSGPAFLKKSKRNWPIQPQHKMTLKEFDRTLKCIMTVTHQLTIIDEINHGNSFRKLQRIMACVIRAIRLFKLKKGARLNNKEKSTYLTTQELEEASRTIFKMIQQVSYKDEIRCLNRNQPLPNNNNLKTPAPFVDQDGILRVGGRLQQSALSFEERHPILVPQNHFVIRLYMVLLHVNNLHAGSQALTAISRQRVWIPQARQLARSIVNSCIRCVRIRPICVKQTMGQLPKARVTAARPFINSGVDFFGPVWTHYSTRGRKAQKTYIAVFCCFTTKAVHLEVVSDLSTNAFLGALKRFTARRGFCQNIYCDNAKNFVGANNQLSELQNIIFENTAMEHISRHCAENRIQFHFIPPRAPHMGGLWEAAVKSAKYLFNRTVASTALTYVELCTVTAEIEAVMNSRPLTPMSSDPNDLNALTPGHFLIGQPMTATVDPHASNTSLSLMSRWQLVSYCKGEFWKRWSIEYLTSLQKYVCWVKEYPNMMKGTLVLIKDDNLPPLQWALGRIMEVIYGPDGNVRVADVRTAKGIIRRAVHYLAPLPVEVEALKIDHDVADQQQALLIEEESSVEYDKRHSLTKDDHKRDKNLQQSNQPDVEVSVPKRRRSNSGTNLATALIVLLVVIPLSAATHVKVQQLVNNAGIFYNPKGNFRLSPTHWTIMAYVRLDSIQAMEGEIETALLRMKTITERIANPEPYTDIIKYFEGQLERAKQYSHVLLYNPAPRFRSKRAAINLVGTIFNKMFGLLDEEYAQNMKTTIDNVQTNENLLKQLLDNHTSILDTTINVFKRDRQDILKQISQLKKIVETNYINMSNKIAQEYSEGKAVETINLLSTLVTSYLREYNQMQDIIADISFGLIQGHTSLHVITPEQLHEQLNIISQQLPPTLMLPQTDRVDLRPLYRIMATHGQVSGNFFLFKIQIPLLLENQFQLFQLIPLPVIVNNTKMTLQVTAEYLAADLRRNKFYALTEYEVEKCIIFTSEVHVCHQTRPIDDENNGNHQCESQLMLAKTLPRVCTIIYSQSHNTWTRIGITGTWLFSVMAPFDITVICQDGISERMTLQDSGMLSLDKGCTMRAENMSITSYQELVTTFNFITQPHFNLSYFGKIDESTTEYTSTKNFIVDSSFEQNISSLHEQLNKVREDQTELKQLQPRDVHQYTTSYIALVLVVGIIIYLVYRIWQNKKNQNHQSAVDGAQFVLYSLQRERPEDVE